MSKLWIAFCDEFCFTFKINDLSSKPKSFARLEWSKMGRFKISEQTDWISLQTCAMFYLRAKFWTITEKQIYKTSTEDITRDALMTNTILFPIYFQLYTCFVFILTDQMFALNVKKKSAIGIHQTQLRKKATTLKFVNLPRHPLAADSTSASILVLRKPTNASARLCKLMQSSIWFKECLVWFDIE